MKHIKRFERLESTLYKGLYVTPIILDESYCRFLDMYDVEIIKSISDLCEFINIKYYNVLVVKMKKNIQPGLITKNEGDIQHISKDIYDFLNERGIESRVVYGEGTVGHFENDIHRCDIGVGPKGSLLVGIGRKTDSLKGKSGIFDIQKIN